MVVRRRSTPGFGVARSPDLTRVENERELGMAMRACADAHLRGDLDRADHELRLAIGLAESLRDTARLRKLRSVASEGPDGRLRVRPDVPRGRILGIGIYSTKTARPQADPPDLLPQDAQSPHVCPRCATTAMSPKARFCEACGHRFGETGAADMPMDAL
jgi:Ca-activated chloride channel family protein